MPQDYPLYLYRGDSYSWQFVLWLDAGRTQPMDLTGVTVAATISSKYGLVPLLCTTAGNTITVTLSAANSALLTVTTTSAWDLQLTYPSGEVHTIVAGTVFVRADVTGATVPAVGGVLHG
jgi:hypothetical protein